MKFSIYWGLACTFVMDVIHPIIYKFIKIIPFVAGVVLLSIIMAVFAVDCMITLTTILKFNRKLKIMDEVAVKIHKLSDEIGENIYENVSGVIEKSEEFQETHSELLNKITDTKDNLMELTDTAKAKITESTEAAKEKLSGYKENLEAVRLQKQHEIEELEKKYQDLLQQKNFGFKRLMKAFPNMTSRDQNETLQKYKKYFNIKKFRDEKEK